MAKDLTERFKEIDTEDLDNVLTFLYKEDTKRYDLNDISDIYELYYFTTYFGNKMKESNIKRLRMLMGGQEKMPGILQIGKKAVDIIDQYASIKRFTDISIEDEAFHELYTKIYNKCFNKVNEGYVCYLKTYTDREKRATYHHLYLAHERDFEKHFPVIMLQLIDVEDEKAYLEVTFNKAATKKEAAKKEQVSVIRNEYRYDITGLDEEPRGE